MDSLPVLQAPDVTAPSLVPSRMDPTTLCFAGLPLSRLDISLTSAVHGQHLGLPPNLEVTLAKPLLPPQMLALPAGGRHKLIRLTTRWHACSKAIN